MKDDYQLVLIDGSSYLFRAFHALPPLTTSKGQPTGAIRGVISMIRKLMADFPNSQVACVFDAKGKSFRNDIYKDYKANRPPMPDDLRSQISPIHDIIRYMGLPILMVEGVEADDVIGTLAGQATDAGMDVLISTGDKDMAQLVNPRVTLINTMNDVVMDEAGVAEKFGVQPNQIIDYLALVGDTSDNIPGVPKCGPKTAVKWLSAYDTLQGVLDNADQIGGKVGENLRSVATQLPMSFELATIKQDVQLDQGVADLVLGQPDTDALLEIFTSLEFKPWADEMHGDLFSGQNEPPPAVDYDVILSVPGLQALVDALSASALISIHVATAGNDYVDAVLTGLAFSTGACNGAYIPIAHDEETVQLDADTVLTALRPLLQDRNKTVIGHDIKYAKSVLAKLGVDLNISFDTMIESYVLNSVGSRHNLDDLALKYLALHTMQYEDVAGKGAKQISFDKVGIAQASRYAAEVADVTGRLHTVLWEKLEETPTLAEVFTDIELPLISILSTVERNGVLLDSELLLAQSKEIDKRLHELTQEAYGLAGEEFNLGSPKQLQEIFFEKLQLPVLKKTPKGQPSTAEPVLQELALDYQLPRVIMEYRALSKLKSTYTDQLPRQVHDSTGRVHTSYHQAVAATGRLSSVDPNLQNIPIRTEEGRRIRKAFVAPEGYQLVAADYSQIELRIMAHLSGDKGLIDAFQNKLDIHRATAAEVFDTALEDVKDYQRRSAKAINFGLIYGMSAFGLARQLNINRSDAQQYIDLYFDRYPGVREYMDGVRQLAADQGYVETIFGRRLYLPEINAKNFQRRQAAERTAINAPMQGSAADIIKRAMIAVDGWLSSSELNAKMIMQVHDELVLEVEQSQIDEVVLGLGQHMASAASLRIPLVVETGIGNNWDDAH
jgi:DNA polymerase I